MARGWHEDGTTGRMMEHMMVAAWRRLNHPAPTYTGDRAAKRFEVPHPTTLSKVESIRIPSRVP